MTIFQWREWWRFRRAATGRHGLHAPFVYRFLDEGLRARQRGNVTQRCTTFLEKEGLAWEKLSGEADVMLRAFEQLAPQLEQGLVILVPLIHSTRAHAALWKALCADARVNRSIELWNLGLLFNKKDFKERQHFVLKAPR